MPKEAKEGSFTSTGPDGGGQGPSTEGEPIALDWRGVSRGLLPSSYLSVSPYLLHLLAAATVRDGDMHYDIVGPAVLPCKSA